MHTTNEETKDELVKSYEEVVNKMETFASRLEKYIEWTCVVWLALNGGIDDDRRFSANGTRISRDDDGAKSNI